MKAKKTFPTIPFRRVLNEHKSVQYYCKSCATYVPAKNISVGNIKTHKRQCKKCRNRYYLEHEKIKVDRIDHIRKGLLRFCKRYNLPNFNSRLLPRRVVKQILEENGIDTAIINRNNIFIRVYPPREASEISDHTKYQVVISNRRETRYLDD